MIQLLDYEIDKLIEEDLPFLDLTSGLLDIHQQPGRITIFTREKGIACGTEEAVRMFNKFQIEVEHVIPSGSEIHSGDALIIGRGGVQSLHAVWKAAQNILDYCSGIATKTHRLTLAARRNNPHLMLLSTRKTFPGTRKLALKAIVAGGGLPHRLNLSETVLVFRNHLNLIGGVDEFIRRFPQISKTACEKKILVETSDMDEAKKLAAAGIHGIQFDKVTFEHLKDHLSEIRKINPRITILVAGGINEQNICSYSHPDIDGIVTSSLYHGKPLDLGADIRLLETNNNLKTQGEYE